jgi:CrcB protein
VSIGGALGACARYALALGLAPVPGKWPMATFVANMLGSFAMGMCFYIIVDKGLLSESWRHFLMIGCLGAFTTFSTFAIEALSLLQYQNWKLALVYAISSCLGAIVAVFLGFQLSKWLI